ncbi:hypothetical protein V1477_001857 [Vespula maculifrons]|uniref:Uncharacterized protein n=2 Tax=Vespula TaxID=7451 RepID=A0A834NJ18_VESVU|nr:uncharacterized protein LOC127070606 [Vespula vulgaris]KAF7411242.1 hypothetical protein HZH66_000138 [Vespula vulgaris]
MALRMSKGEVPENAIALTRSEAIKYQWNQIHKWKPQREVWPFSYGVALLGGVAALSGVYINMRIRKSLKLRSFGTAASAVTMSVCPGSLVCIAQLQMVTEKTFFPLESCPLCIEMRSIVVQNCGAIIYPMILSPIVNFLIAKRDGRFRMPYYTNWKEMIYFCVNLFKPIVPSLGVLGAINALAAAVIVYKQFNCLSYIREVLSVENESDELQKDF